MKSSSSDSRSVSPSSSIVSTSATPLEEATPLLGHEASNPKSTQKLHHGKSALFVWVTIFCIIFMLTTTAGLIQAPWQRIMESVFCKYYYQEHDPSKIGLDGEVEEIWCKIPGVHRPMASLRGWYDSIGSLPGVFLPIPFGILADRIGRKKILLLSLSGLFVEFFSLSAILFFHNTISIRFILASPVVELFSGGASVAIATALTMVADSVSPEERAVAYFRISAASMIGPLIAYPIAALIMTFSPYLSMLLALILAFSAVLLAIPLPETLNLEEARRQREIAAESRADLPKDTLVQKIRAVWIHLVQSTRALLHHQAVIWLLPVFLVGSSASMVMDFLLQYASEKFRWSFRNASILPEINLLTNTLLLMVLLPALSHYLTNRRNMSSARKDLLLTRSCIIISITGFILIGAAPSMTLLVLAIVVYSMGGAFLPSTRALLVGLVRPEQNARLFAVCGTLTYLGGSVFAPLIAKTYGWGLDKGGLWLGAPFWLASCFLLIGAIPLFILRFKGDNEDPSIVTAVLGQDAPDQSDAITLYSEEAEEARERERLGTKFVSV